MEGWRPSGWGNRVEGWGCLSGAQGRGGTAREAEQPEAGAVQPGAPQRLPTGGNKDEVVAAARVPGKGLMRHRTQ